jgi:hypothetical protein
MDRAQRADVRVSRCNKQGQSRVGAPKPECKSMRGIGAAGRSPDEVLIPLGTCRKGWAVEMQAAEVTQKG